jgi:hypothetical protein
MNLAQRAALETKLGKGGWTGDALEKALSGACVVPDRSERFPTATLVVEVILGARTLLFHFEGDSLLGATNP